jgi:UDP-N-acetylmuramoylalanine--D-glutamate ligase
VGGLGRWLEEVDRSRVVCVTGTKGKSTTTAVAAHLARGLGCAAFAGGNLGLPPYDPAAPADAELWVIETSSYQATDVASSPPLVAVTALAPDHLPWHGGVEAYYRDKLSLCSQPGAALTVAPADPLLVERRGRLGPEVRWVSEEGDDRERPSAGRGGGSSDGSRGGRAWMSALGLVGDHNRRNAAVARACLEAFGVPGSDDDEALAAAAAGFAGLSSRLEHVANLGGVDVYDDSLSTNVLPTVAAVAAFPGRRVALIAGGYDRDIDYGPLAAALAGRDVPTLVLTVYSTGPRIRDAIEQARAAHVEAVPCRDLRDAVARGYDWARPDGVLLLSPAAASFDAFTDFAHRAKAYRDLVAELPER